MRANKLHLTYFPSIGWALFVALVFTTWSALTLAEWEHFSPWPCMVLGLGVAGLWWAFSFRFSSGGESPEQVRTLLPVLLVAFLSLLFTLPPSEMILGGWDPGVYLHTASGLAAEGGLRFSHPEIAALAGQEKALVARDLFGIVEPFGGMRVLPDGKLSPQFYHAYPSLLAVAWALGGVWVALMVNPLLNVGCILAAAALATSLFGKRGAFPAALLFALQPAQIWQAKFSTAEILTQFFLLGGFALLAKSYTSKKPAWGHALLAGMALGMALLTRYDTLLFLVPVVMMLVLMAPFHKNRLVLCVVLAVLGLLVFQAWYHQRYVAPYYRPLVGMVLPGLKLAGWGCGAWLGLTAIPKVRAFFGANLKMHQGARGALALVFSGWCLFAWLVRPTLGTTRWDARGLHKLFEMCSLDAAWSFLAGRESSNMLYLQDLMGPLALGLSILSVAVMIFYTRRAWVCAWLYGSVAVTVLLTASVFHDHFLMWVGRRFVPTVLPLLMLGLVGGWVWLRQTFKPVISYAVLALVLLLNLPGSATSARVQDWPGLVGWMEKVAAEIPGDTRVYVDQPGFAAPLRFMHGREAFELHFPHHGDRREQLASRLAERVGSGERIYYLSAQPMIPVDGVQYREVLACPLKTSILVTSKRRPRSTKPRGGDFVLYELKGFDSTAD